MKLSFINKLQVVKAGNRDNAIAAPPPQVDIPDLTSIDLHIVDDYMVARITDEAGVTCVRVLGPNASIKV